MTMTMKLCVPILLLFVFVMNLKSSSAYVSQINKFNGRLPLRSRGLELSAKCKVWIEHADDGFVDEDENLMTGEVCLRSMKAFASDPDDGEKRFLGAAALVSRPSSDSDSDICDCWMADSVLKETNIQVQGAMLLLDDLFYYHLQRSNANTVEGMISSFVVQSGSAESEYHCASYMAALNRGFKPLKDLTYDQSHAYAHLEHLDLEDEDLDSLVFDISSGIERYFLNRSSDLAMSISDMIQRVKPESILERHFE
jgi:hypothetical protein